MDEGRRWVRRAGSVAGLTLLTSIAGVFPLAAQAPTEAMDVFEEALFPAELIMQHRRAIGLTDEQRDAISQMIQELQGRVVSLQWELLDDMETISETLSAPRVDLDRAMDHLEEVLETEKAIKQAHLELLIRIKNALTADQQETLARLRSEGQRPDE